MRQRHPFVSSEGPLETTINNITASWVGFVAPGIFMVVQIEPCFCPRSGAAGYKWQKKKEASAHVLYDTLMGLRLG